MLGGHLQMWANLEIFTHQLIVSTIKHPYQCIEIKLATSKFSKIFATQLYFSLTFTLFHEFT